MKEFEVTCINKKDRFSKYDHIIYIGNINNNWRLKSEEAIKRIESKKENFYVLNPNKTKKAYIGIVRESGKQPYLRTYADGSWNDNLLSLPECSNSCKII